MTQSWHSKQMVEQSTSHDIAAWQDDILGRIELQLMDFVIVPKVQIEDDDAILEIQ